MIRIDFNICGFTVVFLRESKTTPAWGLANTILNAFATSLHEDENKKTMGQIKELIKMFPGNVAMDQSKPIVALNALLHALAIASARDLINETTSALIGVYGEKPYHVEEHGVAKKAIRGILQMRDLPVLKKPSIKAMLETIESELTIKVTQKSFDLGIGKITITTRPDQKIPRVESQFPAV